MTKGIFDLIIIGSGSAGLTSAIYSARANMNTLVIGGRLGGQTATSSDIGNYPGTPEINGADLITSMISQAESFGAKLVFSKALNLNERDGSFAIDCNDSETYLGRSVIIATGAVPRKIGVDGEDRFEGKGISYCATCDGFFYRQRVIFVVGGGNSAAEEALFLTKFAKRVYVIVRDGELKCESTTADKVKETANIELLFYRKIIKISGEDRINHVEVEDIRSGEKEEYDAEGKKDYFGVFVFIGYEPASTIFAGQLNIDDRGYIVANDRMETNIPGVFVAGDVRQKELRQIVTATADGATAAINAERFVKEQRQQNSTIG